MFLYKSIVVLSATIIQQKYYICQYPKQNVSLDDQFMVYTITNMSTTFATWLLKQLEDRDWSMRKLAIKSGIAHAGVSKIVNDAQPPTYEFCVAIAKGLGLPLDEVLALAGLLPKSPELTPELQEWIYIFEQLTDEDRAELMQFGRYKVGRREKLKAKT